MYSEKEASAIRKKFWTSLGQYMAPVPSASGESVNWINYKTGIKGISFKMNADTAGVYAAVEIYNQDIMLQHHYFDLFHKFARGSDIFSDRLFRKDYITESGITLSSISVELKGVNILREDDWPTMISFIKKHLIILDEFWNEFKPAFE